MMDQATFLAGYPEFAESSPDLVAAKLAEAELQVDEAVCGAQTDIMHGLTTAHLLAISPFGMNARMVSKEGTTTYGERLAVMQRRVSGGAWLI